MTSASMARRKSSSDPTPRSVEGEKSSPEGSPASKGAWTTICKYIVMFNGAMAGAKALWDNVNLLAAQAPTATQFLLDTAFFAGALTVYVFAAFLPLGLIVTTLVDGSDLDVKVKRVLYGVVIVGCLGWGAYKAFLHHDAPLVPLYTRIIGAVALAAVAGVLYQEFTARRASKTS